MPKMSRTKPTADEIAEMASRGEDVSAYFTNKFTVVRPVRRVNVDLTHGMLRELDERAARLNISRQAVIKTVAWAGTDQRAGWQTGAKEEGWLSRDPIPGEADTSGHAAPPSRRTLRSSGRMPCRRMRIRSSANRPSNLLCPPALAGFQKGV